MDIIVPDQVFFGLIDSNIFGPFIKLPKIQAHVSLIKDIKIVTKINSLLKVIEKYKRFKNKNKLKINRIFLNFKFTIKENIINKKNNINCNII